MNSSTRVESLPKLSFTKHGSDKPPLVLVHAQGTDSHSFDNVVKPLTKDFTVYTVDCFGHGASAHDPALYNIVSLGDALIDFIECEIEEPSAVLGHSSGGLIAAYAAGRTSSCSQLILEDPPFFSSQGERRNGERRRLCLPCMQIDPSIWEWRHLYDVATVSGNEL